jgi:uncharacterized protein
MKYLLCTLGLLLAAPAVLATDYKVGDRLAAPAAEKSATYKEVTWDDLLPKDWDPMKAINELKLDKLKDSDPRAMEAMEKLKRMWNEAPANPAINGHAIRIAGFMVPLEWGKHEVKEFLLVPYFGACIHVPPPPANQIIYVKVEKGFDVQGSFDPVTVTGTIKADTAFTGLADAGYSMNADSVEIRKE